MVPLDSSSEINTIYSIFAKELNLPIRPIDVGVQKFDGITLDIYGMVVAVFLEIDKVN